MLETCAKTLEFLCQEGHSLFTRCDVARSTIVDMIVASYKDAVDDWRNLLLGEETPDDDETFNVCSSLKKLSLFYACHNINQWNLWDTLFQDVKVSDGTGSTGMLSRFFVKKICRLREFLTRRESNTLNRFWARRF